MKRPQPQDFFKDWKAREALAEAMIPLIGKLYRENNVSLYMYGRNMVNRSVTDLMKAHRFVRQVEQNELSEFDTFPMIEALTGMDLGPAHVDIGKLTVGFQGQANGRTPRDYLQQVIGNDIGAMRKPLPQPLDVVLYGFGRIGRLLARILIEKTGGGDTLRLRAIVVRKGGGPDDLDKRASLLRRDSVHGPFRGTIRVLDEERKLVCNGNEIHVIEANSPAEVDYTQYGISNAIVIDNTGAWRDEAGLSRHLECPGAAKVILTAPGKGRIPNIVYGVNQDEITPDQKILSAASCTTNAIVPVLKAVLDEYGIRSGHVETVHSYTNDQNLIDNYHKGARRGRSAPLNMVITETGAANAATKVLPELAGKLTGNAIRVPTPNVSLAILNLRLGRSTTVAEINEFMRRTALFSALQQQIGYTISSEAVSTDFVGDRHACVFDSQATIVNGDNCVLYCWYDNEFGYSCQVVRCLEEMAGVRWAMYPAHA
ncbi:MAG: glyceraldehyde-3-phosphate dehydrogenase [Porticoccaceae bacterium]